MDLLKLLHVNEMQLIATKPLAVCSKPTIFNTFALRKKS
jgi:hypothetical protein